MKINLPLVIWLPRKTTDDKRCPMNMNFYRNLHHMTNNQMKVAFKEHVKSELGGVQSAMGGPYSFTYTIYPERKSDIMNIGAVLDKFTADALIELGVIKDDNCKLIPEFHFLFGGIDKENPRCELEITRLPD